ncbi:MAG: aldo/keto reductase [Acidobacteria bacterium]|nr:aldo/keto reductase [Acidobacteriota bacterium]
MNRRNFICKGAVAAGAVSLANFPHHLLAGTTKKNASDRILLGPKKIELSRLAMGTGTNGVGGSSNQTKKNGVTGMSNLLKAGFDNGVNFWDTADQYGSHPHVKEGLKLVPRDKVVLLSKTRANTYQEAKADIDRFRRELNSDYIDILLMHCMLEGDWPERRKGVMDAITEAQEKGIVRTKGVSCHTIEALRASARTPWLEVQLARINPAQVAMDADPKTVISVLRELKSQGRGVIGMKILGAGRLRNKADECLQFALSLDCVDVFTIGSESRAEMEDLVSKIPAASVRG